MTFENELVGRRAYEMIFGYKLVFRSELVSAGELSLGTSWFLFMTYLLENVDNENELVSKDDLGFRDVLTTESSLFLTMDWASKISYHWGRAGFLGNWVSETCYHWGQFGLLGEFVSGMHVTPMQTDK